MGTYLVQTKPRQKKSSKFTKKITHVDDMMIHNLVKILVQTRLCLWDIKITNFYKSSGQVSGLKFVIFISHKQSRVWTKYFTRLCIIYIYMLVYLYLQLSMNFAHTLHRERQSCSVRLHEVPTTQSNTS